MNKNTMIVVLIVLNPITYFFSLPRLVGLRIQGNGVDAVSQAFPKWLVVETQSLMSQSVVYCDISRSGLDTPQNVAVLSLVNISNEVVTKLMGRSVYRDKVSSGNFIKVHKCRSNAVSLGNA